MVFNKIKNFLFGEIIYQYPKISLLQKTINNQASSATLSVRRESNGQIILYIQLNEYNEIETIKLDIEGVKKLNSITNDAIEKIKFYSNLEIQ
jgi:hypothetical protein